VLRSVLKQGENNGRRFFACPTSLPRRLDHSPPCNFFQWARDDVLSGIPGDTVLL